MITHQSTYDELYSAFETLVFICIGFITLFLVFYWRSVYWKAAYKRLLKNREITSYLKSEYPNLYKD